MLLSFTRRLTAPSSYTPFLWSYIVVLAQKTKCCTERVPNSLRWLTRPPQHDRVHREHFPLNFELYWIRSSDVSLWHRSAKWKHRFVRVGFDFCFVDVNNPSSEANLWKNENNNTEYCTVNRKKSYPFKNNDLWRSGAAFTLHARSVELNRHSMRLGIEIMHSHSCACVCFRNSNDFSFARTKTTNARHLPAAQTWHGKITWPIENIFVKCVCKGTHASRAEIVKYRCDIAGNPIHLLL